jgi:subtilisin-like proprotein convertase family protein
MKFFVNGVQSGSTINIASLPPSGVDSVTFSWTPTAIGNHTLKICHGLAVDQNRNNDTVTAVVDVLPTSIIPQVSTFCRNGLNKPILDFQTVRDTITVNISNALNVIDANARMDTVVHTFDGDLSFTLAHLAANVALISNRGGGGDNFIQTLLNDSAANPISSGSAPFTGTFRPESPLSAFNNNPVNGTWVLAINDNAGDDSGFLRAWCLILTYETLIGGIQTIEIPNYYSLSQNYPNPFNPSTQIKFSVPKTSNVTMKVYDVLGKEVAVLVNNELKQAGFYTVEFNASNLASGIYFYRINAGDYSAVKKMVLVK